MKFNFDYQDFEPKNICNVGIAILGAAVVGGAVTAYSSSQAASAQTSAANKASETALRMYGQTREDLSPFRQAGADAQTELQQRLPFLTSPIVMDQAALEKTPGWDFVNKQGQRAVTNSAAARGLGVSGAALKGASEFATGLANKTYQDQFNLENINRTNAYDRLMGLVRTGQASAAQTGAAGTAAANTTAGAQIGAGNAQAAAFNATGAAVTQGARDIGGYAAYQGIYGGAKPAGTGGGIVAYTPDTYAHERA